ncbi:hypothetical protein [Dehalococcoides mccartyi]|nr:hypothetical protein [Dehalococcoides mccartyi]
MPAVTEDTEDIYCPDDNIQVASILLTDHLDEFSQPTEIKSMVFAHTITELFLVFTLTDDLCCHTLNVAVLDSKNNVICENLGIPKQFPAIAYLIPDGQFTPGEYRAIIYIDIVPKWETYFVIL